MQCKYHFTHNVILDAKSLPYLVLCCLFLFIDKILNNDIKYKGGVTCDTGKYVDINRKFIKTYAVLVRELKINKTNKHEFISILYYLNEKILKGNIYIPEDTCIYRGRKLFDEKFPSISYDELDEYLREIGKDEEIIQIFDDLYRKIRYNQ